MFPEDLFRGNILTISSVAKLLFGDRARNLLNKRQLLDDKNLINRATKGVYELGSVFKTFTYAVGLNEGYIDPDTEFKNLEKKNILWKISYK